jgi:hypothetical protein
MKDQAGKFTDCRYSGYTKAKSLKLRCCDLKVYCWKITMDQMNNVNKTKFEHYLLKISKNGKLFTRISLYLLSLVSFSGNSLTLWHSQCWQGIRVNNSIDLGSHHHHTYLAPEPFILKIHALSGPYLQYEQWNKHVRELELLNAMEEDSDKRHFTWAPPFGIQQRRKGRRCHFFDKEEIGVKWFFSLKN